MSVKVRINDPSVDVVDLVNHVRVVVFVFGTDDGMTAYRRWGHYLHW